MSNSTIGPYTAIGNNASVEESTITNSMINNGAEIIDSKLNNSIVGYGTKVNGYEGELNSGDGETV